MMNKEQELALQLTQKIVNQGEIWVESDFEKDQFFISRSNLGLEYKIVPKKIK